MIGAFEPKRVFQWVLDADIAVMRGIERFAHPQRTAWMVRVTNLSDGIAWTVYSLLLILLDGPSQWVGIRIAVAAISASLIAQGLKKIIQRPRPHPARIGWSARYDVPACCSMPSGHTMTAFTVAILVAQTHPLLGLFLIGFASMVGVSRVYLGAHYPLDVVFGALLGTTLGLLLGQFWWLFT